MLKLAPCFKYSNPLYQQRALGMPGGMPFLTIAPKQHLSKVKLMIKFRGLHVDVIDKVGFNLRFEKIPRYVFSSL